MSSPVSSSVRGFRLGFVVGGAVEFEDAYAGGGGGGRVEEVVDVDGDAWLDWGVVDEILR